MALYPSQASQEQVNVESGSLRKQLAIAGGLTVMAMPGWWYLGKLSGVMISIIDPEYEKVISLGVLEFGNWQGQPWWMWAILLGLVYGWLWAIVGLTGLLIKNWFARLILVLISSLAWVVAEETKTSSWLLLVVMIGYLAMTHETIRNQDLYKKFSLSKLLLPTAGGWFFTLTLMLAVPVYLYFSSHHQVVEVWVEEKIIKPQVELMVDSSKNQLLKSLESQLPDENLNNFDSQSSPLLIPRAVPKLETIWGQGSEDGRAAIEEEIKRQMVKQIADEEGVMSENNTENLIIQATRQVKESLAPVLKYAYILVPLLFFLTVWQTTSFLRGLIWLVPWGLFELVKLMKLAGIGVRQEPVEFLET